MITEFCVQPSKLELAIKELISNEPTLDDKLNLLTEIGLTSTNEITFKACEEVRSEICNGDDSLPDSKGRKGDSVESGSSRKKVRNVLPKKSSDALRGEDSTRNKLQALLSSLKKEKTFTFEGHEFSTSLVKSFLKECKNLPDLKIEVLYDSMFFTWANGNAKINAYPIAENIKEQIKKANEALK